MVNILSEQVWTSDNLKNYFKGIDKPNYIANVKKFLFSSLKLDQKWEGKSMREIHEKFNINEEEYAEWMDSFLDALTQVGIQVDEAMKLIKHIDSRFKAEILNM